MELGDVAQLEFSFNVPPDAELGGYSFKLRLEYRYVVTEGTKGEYREQCFSFDLPLQARPELTVELVDSYLVKGSSQAVKLSLTYHGPSTALIASLAVTSTAASVSSLSPQPPFTLSPGSRLDVEVELFVPAEASKVDLSLRAGYLVEGVEGSLEACFSLPAIESSKPLVVESSSYGLRPGSLNTVELRLLNRGELDAERVHALLSCEGMTLVGPSELDVEEVPSGGCRSVEVLVKPQEGASSYAVHVELSYVVGGRAYEDSATLHFTESTRPSLSFTSVEVSRSASSVYVRGQVINLGTSEAEYVNVTASASVGLRMVKSSAYLGTLEPGEAASFLMTGEVEEEGVFYVTLKACYADEAGEWYSESRVVEVEVEAAAPREGVGVPLSSLALPLALMGTGLFASGLIIGKYVGWRREAK